MTALNFSLVNLPARVHVLPIKCLGSLDFGLDRRYRFKRIVYPKRKLLLGMYCLFFSHQARLLFFILAWIWQDRYICILETKVHIWENNVACISRVSWVLFTSTSTSDPFVVTYHIEVTPSRERPVHSLSIQMYVYMWNGNLAQVENVKFVCLCNTTLTTLYVEVKALCSIESWNCSICIKHIKGQGVKRLNS